MSTVAISDDAAWYILRSYVVRGCKIVPIIGAYLCAALMICAPLASNPFPQAATQTRRSAFPPS